MLQASKNCLSLYQLHNVVLPRTNTINLGWQSWKRFLTNLLQCSTEGSTCLLGEEIFFGLGWEVIKHEICLVLEFCQQQYVRLQQFMFGNFLSKLEYRLFISFLEPSVKHVLVQLEMYGIVFTVAPQKMNTNCQKSTNKFSATFQEDKKF